LRKALPATVAALVLWTAACGGGGGRSSSGGSDGGPGKPPSSPEAVIKAWADTLRRGDVGRAAAYFSLPAVVQNGTPPLRLTTRAEVRAFNSGLPCGARLLRAYAAGRYTAAVFRLTERPGAGRCGSGTGQTARTAFVVRGGKIREWRRLIDVSPPPSGPVV